MKIRLLGTGGADGIPGFGSTNEVSRYARQHKGKEIRTRCAALVDTGLKIDLPPDTFWQLNRENLEVTDWTGLVFTHSHEDHLAVSELQYVVWPFTELVEVPFSIYGNHKVSSVIRERYPEWPIDITQMLLYNSYRHADYTIIPIRANHSREEECFNLIIQRDQKTLIYATDTGIWSEETFDFLKGFKADCLVIECTEGLRHSPYSGHLDVFTLTDVLKRLRGDGVLKSGCPVVTTHHAHTGNARHCDLVAALEPLEAEPGYDGMVIDF